MLTFISEPFEFSLRELRVEMILVGQSSSTDTKIHLLISSWIKSDVVIDFFANVVIIC